MLKGIIIAYLIIAVVAYIVISVVVGILIDQQYFMLPAEFRPRIKIWQTLSLALIWPVLILLLILQTIIEIIKELIKISKNEKEK